VGYRYSEHLRRWERAHKARLTELKVQLELITKRKTRKRKQI